ncbi:hypothetical protein SAMN02746065_10311 [Desulfocicer vacuolatum DSM 3385]|uniref:DUF1009 domain-containing protein n=2 Tax=Desulfocicer vacuolatum TaxID=2298 RepID=A0A1W1ZMH6_9BACT|nr:hypothetical protein SAMN02746065_10311 [Desulfocicer vacuolatum DSM 3385]
MLFARRAKEKGIAVHAAAYINEASLSLEEHVDSIQWLHLGQVTKLLKFFQRRGVTRAVMLGTVKKTRIFTDIKPDLKALAFIATMGHTHDDGIMRAFADLLGKEGITICPSTMLLPDLISPKGCWTRKKPGRAAKKDIETGWHIAGEIGRLDIGQCVVVSNGTVLAVEAADGTDATIGRGGSLSRGGAVVVKRCKPGQDLRFDLPSSGVRTILAMVKSGVDVLVLEAGKSLSFDRREMIDLADEKGISIVAMGEEDF